MRTWYRVGRSGGWGDVRAEWNVALAVAPYVYRRTDGTWKPVAETFGGA